MAKLPASPSGNPTQELTAATNDFLSKALDRILAVAAATDRERLVFFPNGIELIDVEVSGKVNAVELKVAFKVAGPKSGASQLAEPVPVPFAKLAENKDLFRAFDAQDKESGALETFADQEVSPAACRGIVVAATPKKEKFTNNSQLLKDLGVVDAKQTKFHIDGIVQGMKAAGGSIDSTKITSGPQVSVGACTASVHQNQDGSE